jgi:transposase
MHKLYQCHDLILAHKKELFDHLTERWKDMFNAKYEVLLYDLTSSYFESDGPFEEDDKRKYGYSRDKRPDCVQVVIGLVVTPEGFPLAYEVMAGNTSDKTTLQGFLEKIEEQYGKAQRIWIMDRGIPTEEVLEIMRRSDPPVLYLVGTPKGRLSKLEKKLSQLPWHQAREGVEVKLLAEEGEVYVLAKSAARINKERSMRRRQLKSLWKRLHELQAMELTRDELLMKLGAAKQRAPSAWRLVEVTLPEGEEKFGFRLRKDKLREVRRREGRYLLRSNMPERPAGQLWEFYLQLVQVEEAFKQLKSDLVLRPFHHQKQERIEAHIFVAFLAYCLQVTLTQRLKALAPGLTARSVLEKLAGIEMIDVHLPTTDGREVILTRYTQPDKDQELLLHRLQLKLPEQPPPRITARQLTTQ